MNHTDDEMTHDEKRLVEGIRNLTLYSVIIGLVMLLITGLALLVATNDFLQDWEYLQALGSFVLFSGLSHYLITLFLLPARLYVVVENGTK